MSKKSLRENVRPELWLRLSESQLTVASTSSLLSPRVGHASFEDKNKYFVAALSL